MGNRKTSRGNKLELFFFLQKIRLFWVGTKTNLVLIFISLILSKVNFDFFKPIFCGIFSSRHLRTLSAQLLFISPMSLLVRALTGGIWPPPPPPLLLAAKEAPLEEEEEPPLLADVALLCFLQPLQLFTTDSGSEIQEQMESLEKKVGWVWSGLVSFLGVIVSHHNLYWKNQEQMESWKKSWLVLLKKKQKCGLFLGGKHNCLREGTAKLPIYLLLFIYLKNVYWGFFISHQNLYWKKTFSRWCFFFTFFFFGGGICLRRKNGKIAYLFAFLYKKILFI